jgi:uncharacterized membrane protein
MKKADWLLLWTWVAFVTFIGPFSISARDWFVVGAGFAVLAGLIYLTQRRIRQVIKEKSE